MAWVNQHKVVTMKVSSYTRLKGGGEAGPDNAAVLVTMKVSSYTRLKERNLKLGKTQLLSYNEGF